MQYEQTASGREGGVRYPHTGTPQPQGEGVALSDPYDSTRGTRGQSLGIGDTPEGIHALLQETRHMFLENIFSLDFSLIYTYF